MQNAMFLCISKFCYTYPMNVILSPELEELVERKIKSGRYNTVSEVVSKSLLLLDREDEETEYFRREILKAEEQFKNGQYYTVNSQAEWSVFIDDVKKRGRGRLTKEKDHLT